MGKLAENDHVFEQSTLVFILGEGNVIKAWDEGIVGMRVGQQARAPFLRFASSILCTVSFPPCNLRQYAAMSLVF